MFEGFDHFVASDDADFCLDLPKYVKPIEHREFVDVNIERMDLKSDSGRMVSLRLNESARALSPATQEVFFYVVLHAINGRRKESTVLRWVGEFSLFTTKISNQLEGRSISSITLEMVKWYWNGKSPSQQKLLRSLLKYWVSNLNAPGIQSELCIYLQTSKAPKPPTPMQIQIDDESERPFTIPQVRSMLQSLERMHIADPRFTPQDYFLWRLTISEALRPTQLELLQVRDASVTRDSSGKMISVDLAVPIVKQQGIAGRDYLVVHRLSTPVAAAFMAHLDFITEVSSERIPANQSMFCVRTTNGDRLQRKVSSLDINDRIARTRKSIVAEIDNFTGVDLFTRRFKHTKLTHLAMLGAPLEVLARAGFHTSTISLRRYVNLTDEASDAYEKLLAAHHTELALGMSARLIDREEATNPLPANLLSDPTMDDDVGACTLKPCGVLVPFACYDDCPRFEAFIDGPHHLVAQTLEDRVQRATLMNLAADTVNRDRHILKRVHAVMIAIKKLSN